MPTNTIRACIETLVLCAKDFDVQALSLRQTERGLAQKMTSLRARNWVGTASDQFQYEMDARVFPQLARLAQSFELGRDITRTIQQHWDKADGDAAALLKLEVNDGNVKDRTPSAPDAGRGNGGGAGGGSGSGGWGNPADQGATLPPQTGGSSTPGAGGGSGSRVPGAGSGSGGGSSAEVILPPYEKPEIDVGDPELDPSVDDPDLNFPPPVNNSESSNTPHPAHIPGVSDLYAGLIKNAAQLLNTLTPGAGAGLVASIQQGFGMPQASVEALNAFMPGLGDALQAVIAPAIKSDGQTSQPPAIEFTDSFHQAAVDEITHNLDLIEPGLGADWRDGWMPGAPLQQALVDKLNAYEPELGDHFASWLSDAGAVAGGTSWVPQFDGGIEEMSQAISKAPAESQMFDLDRGMEVFPIARSTDQVVNAAPVSSDAAKGTGSGSGSDAGSGAGGGGSSPAALESAIQPAAGTVPDDARGETQASGAPSAAPSSGGGGGSGSEATAAAPAANASGSYSPSMADGSPSGMVHGDEHGRGDSGPARETTANPNSGYLTPWLNEGNGAASRPANAAKRGEGLGGTSWAALAGAAATVLAAVIGKKANAPARVE